jgi:hypothetical protein
MKEEALHTLLVARTLFEKAQDLCAGDNKFVSSSGLVILQDSLELFFYACLIQLGVDEQRSIKYLPLDKQIEVLRGAGVKMTKTTNISALNNSRINVKHYGKLADPSTVRTYLAACQAVVDSILEQVFGKTLREIMVYDLIKEGELRTYIENACKEIDAGRYYEALVEVRKAIFILIERDYSVEEWRDYDPADRKQGLLALFGLYGYKAPYYTRNKDWIAKNVKDPFDYVQLDHDNIRLDLIEWGVSTQDFWNIWRLTPRVFYSRKSKIWIVRGELKYLAEASTEENARYCVDRAISLILKKQSHFDYILALKGSYDKKLKVKIKTDTNLYEKATTKSTVTDRLQTGSTFEVEAKVAGLNEENTYFKLAHFDTEGGKYYGGYVVFDDCELEID